MDRFWKLITWFMSVPTRRVDLEWERELKMEALLKELVQVTSEQLHKTANQVVLSEPLQAFHLRQIAEKLESCTDLRITIGKFKAIIKEIKEL